MKQNLGKLDRIFRFVLGIWLLGPFAPAIKPVWGQWLCLIIGAIALVESFTASCPVHDWLGINNKNQ
jgi:fatty acid desaturase